MGTIDSAPATVMTEKSMSETAGNSASRSIEEWKAVYYSATVWFRKSLHTSCGFSFIVRCSFLSTLKIFSFSSTTLAYYHCRIRLWFCEGLFHCSFDRWPIEITTELSACCQGNTSSLLLFMRSRDWLLTSPGEGRCQSLVHSWLHRASKNLEDLLNWHG